MSKSPTKPENKGKTGWDNLVDNSKNYSQSPHSKNFPHNSQKTKIRLINR